MITLYHHSQVNMRLMSLEKEKGHSSSGDPARPKAVFPGRAQCPRCRATVSGSVAAASEVAVGEKESNQTGDIEASQWNEREVLRFLER